MLKKKKRNLNQTRAEMRARARQGLGHPGYLFCARVKTTADILHFYTRCWDTIPSHTCLVLERPSVLKRDHSCISMPKYFTYNANSLKEDVMKAKRALEEVWRQSKRQFGGLAISTILRKDS